jgi:predicted SAM-dependent methyltransferase
MSETKIARPYLLPYCEGYGADIGFGGDKIRPEAIGIDLPNPYTRVGDDPVQFGLTSLELPFRNGVLDYIYSSHLLEDFSYRDLKVIITEWVRVLKPGGRLVLFLPNQPVYVEHCRQTGQDYNQAHKEQDFCASTFIANLPRNLYLRVEYLAEGLGVYSWALVLRKPGT